MPMPATQTAQRILHAASHLFADKRFDEVHVDDVAAGAEISKVTLYRYFKNKDELYLKLLEGIGREYLGMLREADRSAKGCRARLVAISRAAMNYFAGK